MTTIIDRICSIRAVKILYWLSKKSLPIVCFESREDLWRKTGVDQQILRNWLEELRDYNITTIKPEYDETKGTKGKTINKHALTEKGKELSKLTNKIYPTAIKLEKNLKDLREKIELSHDFKEVYIVSNPK